jgi:predicted GTPase/GTP-binding protein EngB required for normal cell division
MEQNIFEELQQKKQHLASLATKAKEFGWIDEAQEKTINDKLLTDVLTIGVIGQMKCGKSTFLNAFVFEDDVLPSATTPMTAALSVITYGEEKKIVAEFYTPDEWAEQKMQATRSLEDVAGNTLEESKVKAAKELVEKSVKLGSSLEKYLGKTQDDSFENLIEYVGADGKYISITKSVTIYYPKEYLKGVEIVDTPGFNDPIVSREERTKEFLKKADVVLLMLYAGRPFDATDRDILFKNVGHCGTGRVLVGINKYDIPYENGENESEIKDYVKEQLRRACKECDDSLMIDILQHTEPIPLSAEMALLSELPMSKVMGSEAYKFAWKRACDIFEISNGLQMREKSHIDNLIAAVREVVEKEKNEILFRKPLNAILAAGNKKKTDTEKGIQECTMLINTLNQPDDELEEKQENLRKANRRLNKKIDTLGDDIESSMRDLVRRGRNQLEDDVESACRKMDGIIDSLGRFCSPKKIQPQLDREVQTLINRTLKRTTEDYAKQAKSMVGNSITDFLSEVEDVLMKYIEEFDSREFIHAVDKEIKIDIEDNGMFLYDDNTWSNIGSLLSNVFRHGKEVRELHQQVNKIRSTDVAKFLDTVFARKNNIINGVKTRIIDELISPLQEKIDYIVENKSKREQELQSYQQKLDDLQKVKASIDEQLQTIGNIKE